MALHLSARLSGFLLLLAVALGGCTTPTAYQPETKRYGYADIAIEEDRYRISFRGNSATKRETVEIYLLYRAAELTLQRGGDHFTVVERSVDKDQRYHSHQYWHFGHVYPGRAHGGYYYASVAAPLGDSIPITRYEAIAEIIIGKGAAPEDGPNVYDARDVIAKLEPRISRPAPR